MKKIIAFAGSSSRTSINKQLVKYASQFLENVEVEILDLNNFTPPMYTAGLEENGFPEDIETFNAKLDSADGFLVSLAEHNGSYSAYFKNILDWSSIMNSKVFREKPVLITSTSPGERAAQDVANAASIRFPFLGGKVTGVFSLPSFGDNFKNNEIVDEKLKEELVENVKKLANEL